LSDLTASASYFLAAIAENADRELAEDTYRAVAEVLPYHLRAALDECGHLTWPHFGRRSS
jgi:hypothetical protein